jgi:hypothetical protein
MDGWMDAAGSGGRDATQAVAPCRWVPQRLRVIHRWIADTDRVHESRLRHVFMSRSRLCRLFRIGHVRCYRKLSQRRQEN